MRQNNVNFRISFHSVNSVATKLLEQMILKIREKQPMLSDIFASDSASYNKSSDQEWMVNNIGATSTSLTHYDLSSIKGVSKYAEPDIAVIRLIQELGKVDPKIRVSFEFEDESDSFIGATFFIGRHSKEHWWACLDVLPTPTNAENKIQHFYDLRKEFVQSCIKRKID